jgi:hypothetical protein
MQLPRELRVMNVETGILRSLLEVWPGALSIAAKPLADLRSDESVFENALEGLLVQGRVIEGRDAQHGGRVLKITSSGAALFADRSAGLDIGEMDTIKQTVFRTLSQVIGALEENDKSQHDLRESVEQIREVARSAETTFYSRVVPLFALFVAAFALINAGAQAAVRTPVAADPGTTFWQIAALMGPITIAALVLTGLAWFLTRAR